MLQGFPWVNLKSMAAQTSILNFKTTLTYVAAFEVILLNNPSFGPGPGLNGSGIPFSGSVGRAGVLGLDEADAISGSSYSSQ